jgi:hypothetical protein
MPNLYGKRYREIFSYRSNWTITIIEALMQIALITENKELFDKMIVDYKTTFDNSFKETGMNNELTRDQMHSQFGIASFIQCCELAYNQGIDLYGYKNSLLAKAMEYNNTILNTRQAPPDYPKDKLPIKEMWFFKSSWQIGYNHYVSRKSMKLPETIKQLDRIKNAPEQNVVNWVPAWIFHK